MQVRGTTGALLLFWDFPWEGLNWSPIPCLNRMEESWPEEGADLVSPDVTDAGTILALFAGVLNTTFWNKEIWRPILDRSQFESVLLSLDTWVSTLSTPTMLPCLECRDFSSFSTMSPLAAQGRPMRNPNRK